MDVFPPLPPYSGMHPLIVHFPIALLLVAPLFVILGLLWREQARAMFLAAVLLLAAGSASAFLATSTGEASADVAEVAGGAGEAADRHEELAELARNLFVGVTALGIGLTALYWKVHQRTRRPVMWATGVLFLLLHSGAALVLANAAHEGGRLVHEFGVHAPAGAGGKTASTAFGAARTTDDRHEREQEESDRRRGAPDR